MTQTPLQKAIEQLKEKIENSNYALYAIGCKDAIQILTDLLSYEREVIELAYGDGVNDEAFGRLLGSVADNSTDYFTKTFTNNAD